MSILSVVEALLEEGRLFDRLSSMFGEGPRRVLVTADIDGITRRSFADTQDGERYAALAMYLDAFVEGNEITVCDRSDSKPWDVMLARVRPEERDFWSMRITEPEGTSGMRLLGGFVRKNEFVALYWDFRETMNFDEDVHELGKVWRDYFGDQAPYSGRGLDDYLTNYVAL